MDDLSRQAPYSHISIAKEEKKALDSDFIKIKIGAVNTKNHVMKLRLRTKDDSFQAYEAETTDAGHTDAEQSAQRKSRPGPTIQDTTSETRTTQNSTLPKSDVQKSASSNSTTTVIERNNPIHQNLDEGDDSSEDHEISPEELTYFRVVASILRQKEERTTSQKIIEVARCSMEQADDIRERMQDDGLLGKFARGGYKVLQNNKTRKMIADLQQNMPLLWAAADPSMQEDGHAIQSTAVSRDIPEEDNTVGDATQDGLEESTMSQPLHSSPKNRGMTNSSSQGNFESPERRSQSRMADRKARGRKRKINGEFELSNTQDTQTMDGSVVERKMSTVVDPISQKRMRVYRDPSRGLKSH